MSDREPRPWAGWALGGFVVVLVLLGLAGSLTTALREVALIVGAVATIPFIVSRRRQVTGARIAVLALAWLLVIATVISMLGNLGRSPLPQFLIGWDGRGTGVLAYAAGALLLTAAVLLTRAEVLWTLVGIAVGGLASAGITILGDPSGLMGNDDFNAALCGLSAAIFSLLAVRLWRFPRWRPSGLAVLASACAVAGALTGSWQALGVPAVALLTAGIVVLGIRRNRWGALGAGLVLLVLVTGAVLIAVGVIDLPGAQFAVRRAYWDTAWQAFLQRPWVGFGPDSFAEAVASARSQSYLSLRPPSHFVSAAHSVPMQLLATQGIVAFCTWLALMVCVTVIAVRGIVRGIAERQTQWLIALVIGVWCAYIAQSLISIDQLVVLAIGWLLSGCVVAVVLPIEPTVRTISPWRITASIVCAAVAAVLVLPYPIATSAALSASTSAAEAQVLTSPWTTCVQRVRVAATSSVGLQPLVAAQDLDPRCPGLGNIVVRKALDSGDLLAARDALVKDYSYRTVDPTYFIVEGVIYARHGQTHLARVDLMRARELAAASPRPGAYRPGLRFLAAEIRAARA